MSASRAERPVTAASAGLTTPWGRLSVRQAMELALPGALIGVLGGLIAGALTVAGGVGVDVGVVSGVSLGLPLALGGAAYELLIARGRLPMGPLAPAALVWVVAFPLSRLLHAAVTDLYAGSPVTAPNGWLDFAVIQLLLSVPFATGFWWLHANFAPRWWYHLRNRNPVADHFIRVKLQAIHQDEDPQSKPSEPAPARARARTRRK